MLLLLKDRPVLKISETGSCQILDLDRLPFGLRREGITFPEFVEWAGNRALSIGRSHAKAILNSLGLSQTNRYAVCKACRGVSLEDAYWIRQEGDQKEWKDVNLFHNDLSLVLTELALSGSNSRQGALERNSVFELLPERKLKIHTPELTTLGVSAKGWIREGGDFYLHKTGKYEIPASQILDCLGLPHIVYEVSGEEIRDYLSEERKDWLDGVGEKMVKSRLFTNEDLSLVTFEELVIFCGYYGLNPYEQAVEIDRRAYLQMQVADYVLNNDDRHGQNWGFFMDNNTGKITGACPLFDHDRGFSSGKNLMSQTTERNMTLKDGALAAQRELKLELSGIFSMEKPHFLEEYKWEQVLGRCRELEDAVRG